MLKTILNGYYRTNVERAIAWRRKKIIKGRIDAWEGCPDDILPYRAKLDEIADWITNTGTEFIQSRFNPENGKIELCRFLSWEVVVEIGFCTEGEEHHAVVEYPPRYPDIVPASVRSFVEENLPVKVKFAT